MKTLILTRAEVASLLAMRDAIPAVETAFAAHGRRETQMPSKVYLSLERFEGDFRAMPAYFDGAAGVKWVNSHPQNPARHGLPSVMGVYILSDPATAAPLAVMDATLLTAVRTGAAAAVASRHLARKAPRTLGLVGCGVQARFLLEAHRALFEGLEVLAADASDAVAQRFAAEVGARAASVQQAAGCDIVCTATPSQRPVISRAWLAPGAHINAMGADAPGKQELDPVILREGRVFVDDVEQASHSGEVNVPLHDGTLVPEHIRGTLGEVVAGLAAGRLGDEVTVFDSTGLAVQDVAVARVVYRTALERGVGASLDLVGV